MVYIGRYACKETIIAFRRDLKSHMTNALEHEHVMSLGGEREHTHTHARTHIATTPGDGDSTYSQTSMARTSLGPYTFVRDMGSSSHWWLFMAPGQEAKSDNIGKSFQFSTQ